jgi:small GTP-binding protein
MVFDTAGQERFKTMASTFYKGTAGVLLVYAINDNKTFGEVEKWISEIRDQTDPSCCIILVGNKSDKEPQRQVTRMDGEELARKHNCGFFETSAMTGSQVSDAFEALARKMAKVVLANRSAEPEQKPKKNKSFAVENLPEKNESGCSC